MIEVILENAKGRQLKLTGNENKFQVYEVSGLNPPPASISVSENINDGAEFTHSRVEKRNVVISLQINGDVESNRLSLYEVIQTKSYIKMYFNTYSKKVWIDGYVESIEVDNFKLQTICQISVLCPKPYFKALEETIENMNTVEPNFYFPFYTDEYGKVFGYYSEIQLLNLINQGNVSSGMTIEITAKGSVVNPIVYNRDTTEFIGIGSETRPFTMQKGDKIVITTDMNNKRVKLIRNAVETNIFNYLKEDSTFLQLTTGDNVYTYSADSGNSYIDINFRYYASYEGI